MLLTAGCAIMAGPFFQLCCHNTPEKSQGHLESDTWAV